MENYAANFAKKDEQHTSCKISECLDLEKKSILWRLQLGRNAFFEEMNSDMDEMVDQCLKAKRRLETIEDSNRNLQSEVRSLKSKYQALLEKNKKDTGIIMRLKDSEPVLKQALSKQEETSESLSNLQMKNKEKILERNLLQDRQEKLLFKSQTITNRLRKINLKHKQIYEQIEEENKIGKENEVLLTAELDELRSNLSKDDGILEDWLKDNIKRDSDICRLQDDMRDGLMVLKGVNEDLNSENTSKTDVSSVETAETEQTDIEETSKEDMDEKKIKSDQTDPKETAFFREWTRKKIQYEAAEKQKEHWMKVYMLLNSRIHDLNIELVNIRQWRIDKETEKKEALEKVKQMEDLVSLKRKGKAVPPRSSIDELNIWIKIESEANRALRKVISGCLAMKVEDSAKYLGFANAIRDMYLDNLREKPLLKEMERETTQEIMEDENKT